jgi:putative ABC transport system ATP-binding protein
MSITLDGVTYTPPGADRPVLDNYSAIFATGQCTAITGPSGSGKTTLLSLASLLVPPEHGDICIDDRSTQELSAKQRQEIRQTDIGMLFQTARVFSRMTVGEHLRFAVACGGERSATDAGKVLLEKLGLAHRTQALSAELSGGERARLAAMLALLKKPRVLLADEPTAALDAKNSDLMMDLLTGIAAEEGTTVLVVTHDPEVLERVDGALELRKGG